jgi:hypothetical protein
MAFYQVSVVETWSQAHSQGLLKHAADVYLQHGQFALSGSQIHAQFWQLHSVSGPHVFMGRLMHSHETDTEFSPLRQGLGIAAWCVWTELGTGYR